MLQSNPIIVHGDGLHLRSFTGPHDIVEALVKVGQIEGLSGHSFNLGSTEEATILQLAQMISRLRLANGNMASQILVTVLGEFQMYQVIT